MHCRKGKICRKSECNRTMRSIERRRSGNHLPGRSLFFGPRVRRRVVRLPAGRTCGSPFNSTRLRLPRSRNGQIFRLLLTKYGRFAVPYEGPFVFHSFGAGLPYPFRRQTSFRSARLPARADGGLSGPLRSADTRGRPGLGLPGCLRPSDTRGGRRLRLPGPPRSFNAQPLRDGPLLLTFLPRDNDHRVFRPVTGEHYMDVSPVLVSQLLHVNKGIVSSHRHPLAGPEAFAVHYGHRIVDPGIAISPVHDYCIDGRNIDAPRAVITVAIIDLARRKRYPRDIGGRDDPSYKTRAPVHRPYDGRHPAPAARSYERPAAVMRGRPAPWIIVDPDMTAPDPDPVPIAVGRPAGGRCSRDQTYP